MAGLTTRLVGLLGTQHFQDRERVIDLARAEQVLGKRETADSPHESRLFSGARIPPGKRVRRASQCHRLARLLHPAERPERESQRAIDVRMAIVPRQRFKQGDGICVLSLDDQRTGPSKGRFLVRPKGISTLEGRHRFHRAIEVQQPSTAPEPGGCVIGIDLHRLLEVVEGGPKQPVSTFQQRAEVRPAEVLRIQRRSLRVADQRFVHEQIVLVRHGQATPHQTRGRQGAGVPDHSV